MKSKQLYFLIFVLLSVRCGISQLTIGEYKKLADKEVKFSSPKIFREVKCKGFLAQLHKNGEIVAGDCDSISIIEYPIKFLYIEYVYYSKKLDYQFVFSLGFDSIQTMHKGQGPRERIPKCIRTGRKCNFISKQTALDIARRDSIMFSENLTIELVHSRTTKEFFWLVVGQDKKDVDFSRKSDSNWMIFPQRPKNTRYIQAVNGRIVPYDEFKIKHEQNKQ